MLKKMKTISLLIVFSFFVVSAIGQTKETKPAKPDSTKKIQIVEAACGECQFGMKGDDCDLAIRINDKTYFVDGTHIDSHGDAHAKDGFCKAIRKAEVQGEIVNNRFKSTYFRLLPVVTDSTKNKK
jgi:hypothetical protein